MVRILLSAEVAKALEQPILERMRGRFCQLVVADTTTPEEANPDIAFLSRDIAGSSAKRTLSPSLLSFYAALRASPRLQWLQIFSAGADRAIYQEMRERGVCVTTATGTAAAEVAHSAIGGMLALARRLPLLIQAQQRREWISLHQVGLPAALSGKSAVVVGLGAIGQKIARLLTALDMRVTGVRYDMEGICEGASTVSYGEIDRALSEADWVLFCCPLTDTTRKLLNAQRLAALKPGACVVNVARGEIIDEQALIAQLQAGHLGGAFLDVFEEEPLPSASVLWGLDNVIVTPHSAGHSERNLEQVRSLFLANLERWLASEQMLNQSG